MFNSPSFFFALLALVGRCLIVQCIWWVAALHGGKQYVRTTLHSMPYSINFKQQAKSASQPAAIIRIASVAKKMGSACVMMMMVCIAS